MAKRPDDRTQKKGPNFRDRDSGEVRTHVAVCPGLAKKRCPKIWTRCPSEARELYGEAPLTTHAEERFLNYKEPMSK